MIVSGRRNRSEFGHENAHFDAVGLPLPGIFENESGIRLNSFHLDRLRLRLLPFDLQRKYMSISLLFIQQFHDTYDKTSKIEKLETYLQINAKS